MESNGARNMTWRVYKPVSSRLPKPKPKAKPQNPPASPSTKLILLPTQESTSKRQKTEKSTMATSRVVNSFQSHSQEESRVIGSPVPVEVTPNPPIVTQHTSTAKQTLYPKRISGIAKSTSRPNPSTQSSISFTKYLRGWRDILSLCLLFGPTNAL